MKRKTTRRRNKSQEAAAGTSAIYPRSHPTHPSDALPALLRLNDMDGNPSPFPASCMWDQLFLGKRNKTSTDGHKGTERIAGLLRVGELVLVWFGMFVVGGVVSCLIGVWARLR